MFAADLKTDLPKSTKTKNMKKNLLTLATILTIGFFTNNATAQGATEANQTGTATAHLVKAMSLSQDNGIDFGTILLGASAAETFTLAPTATVLTGGTNHLVSTTNGHTPQGAKFSVSGTRNSLYTVTLPDNSTGIEVSTNGGGAGNLMKIDNLVLKFSSRTADGGLEGNLDTDGKDSFQLGGDLNIALAQNAGIYAGTFAVSVDYN